MSQSTANSVTSRVDVRSGERACQAVGQEMRRTRSPDRLLQPGRSSGIFATGLLPAYGDGALVVASPQMREDDDRDVHWHNDRCSCQ